MKLTQISLSKKIFIICLSLLFILSGISAVLFQNVTKKLNANIGTSIETYTNLVGQSIAAQFYERYGDVQAFAANQIFQNGTQKEIIETLNKYAELYGIYELIFFVDPTGKLIAINNKSAENKPIDVKNVYQINFSHEAWFQKAMKEQYLVDPERDFNGTVFIEPEFNTIASQVYKKPFYGPQFAAPVKDKNGQILGVICNLANFLWIEREILTQYKNLKNLGYTTAQFDLINETGEVLFNYNPSFSKSEEPIEDSKILRKSNLVEDNFTPALAVVSGKSGHMLVAPNGKSEELVSYQKIESPKMPATNKWSVLIHIPTNELYGFSKTAQFEYYLSLALCLILASAVVIFFSGSTGKSFTKISHELRQTSNEVTNMTLNISNSTQELLASSQEQAAALQETVSAIEEMSSMVSQTRENVRISLETSTNAMDKTTEGQKTMENMAESMNEIQKVNVQLEEIASVIESINAKTLIINDIVFKTQLLSFNASIEAARAGTHGRGFAVVAEEVGILAETTNKAAKEIEMMLKENKQKIQHTLTLIKDKIGDGQNASFQAQMAFQTIAELMTEINKQSASINEAIQQQEYGISQTNLVLKQIDESAQKNSTLSLNSNQSVETIKSETQRLMNITENINQLIQGGTAKTRSLKSATQQPTQLNDPMTDTSNQDKIAS